MDEKKLLKKLRSNDREAYGYLFSTYYVPLCNYVTKLCNDRFLAEDIVQETFVIFWKKRAKISITVSLKSYLYKLSYHQFLQHLRKTKLQYEFLDTVKWDILSKVNVEEEASENVQTDRLKTLIDQLPPRRKEIFVRSKLKNHKYREIATDLGISIKTVENQMSKALHFLRDHMTFFMCCIVIYTCLKYYTYVFLSPCVS